MNLEERRARRFVVSGRVQGVGFRAYATRVARSLRLAGGASNLPDGSVLVVADGPVHALDRLESYLWEGSRIARVDSVVATEIASVGPEGSFDVDF